MIRKTDAGQAMALVAVALVAILGFAGLAVDMGVLRYDQRLQQTAADAAAIAGANELRYDSSGVISAGQNASGANGFRDNAGGAVSTCNASSPGAAAGTICVQINNPPQSGPHNGDPHYVEALVSAVHETYFTRIFGLPTRTVEARAVATLVGESGDYPGCIYTLGPPGTGVGVTNNGTPTVNAPDCGIFDNGDWTTDGATVDITAAGIGVVGTAVNHGGGTVTCVDEPNNCPASVPPVSDPLAYLQEPAYTPTVGTPVAFNPAAPVPGTTYSSIDIEGGTVVFPSGLYIVDGNFTINGNATVTGTGVTFYITGGGSVTVNGTSTVQFSAPDSGTYAGILFYQDPNDTSLAKLNGTNTSFYQGALYFPGAQLEFGGTNFTNAQAQYTVIVADDLKFFGTSTVNINANYSSLPGGTSIIENAILVE